MLFCATFTKSISADTSTNHTLENEYQNRQVIERYAIENNEDTLFNQARENTEGITIDENGNYIYKVVQLEEVSLSRCVDKIEQYSQTTFHKIDNTSSIYSKSSITEDGWDKASSAYIKSTTNYTISGNYIKLNSCSGSASKLNSGVKVKNLTVKIGCVAPVAPNQRVTKDYGTATSFSYTPPTSWKQVPNIIGGSTGSLVGSTMNVKLGRSTGSTWTQAFTNNIGFNSNVPIS